MKTRLTHVRANVSNLQKAIEWYESVLGFRVEDLWPEDNPNYAGFEGEEGANFSIMEINPSPSQGRFNFNVQNVDELWIKLKDKAEVVEKLFNTPYGTRKFTIKDLDGNELGFYKINKKTPITY